MNQPILNNRYKPLDIKFSGASGDVIVHTDGSLDRRVAIKYLLPIREKKRFYDEVKALESIRSKHVVQIYDVVVLSNQTNRLGIVQEYIDGADLVPLQEPPLYLNRLFQIASGIADIHGRDLIHRDIKLQNMKIDQEGIVKIFDFDLARSIDQASTLQFKGTPGYAAPELYSGFEVNFTKAVDTYAFAVCALELTGTPIPPDLRRPSPLPPDPEAWLRSGGFNQLRDWVPTILTNLLDQALSPDPKQRPQMALIQQTLKSLMVKDQHQGLLVDQDSNGTYLISREQPVATMNLPTGNFEINYNGMDFLAQEVNGHVRINNLPVKAGDALPGSCVIGFGSPAEKQFRRFVTFDISHPEVVL